MRLLQYLRTRITPCSRTRLDSECDQPGVHHYPAPVAYSTLLRFFLPLAATPLMAYSTHNIIHAALVRLPAPHLSLATFSVVRAACDALKAPVLVSSQVSASLVDSRRSYLLTTSLMWLLAIVIFAFLLVFGYTSLGSLFLYRVIGLRDSAVIALGGVLAAALPAVFGAAAFTMGELAETLFVSARSSIGARTES